MSIACILFLFILNILEVVFINLKDESIYGVDELFASNSFFDEYLEQLKCQDITTLYVQIIFKVF